MFLNIAILPHIREDLLSRRLASRRLAAPSRIAAGRLADIDTHQTLIMRRRLRRRTVTSADPGLLEVAMGGNGSLEQSFPSMAIARRMLLAPFAIIGLRRFVGKAGEAFEVTHVA